MATYTDNKKLTKPANGEYPDTWDVPINNDWDIIDKALGSTVTYTVAGTDITMTIEEAQNQRILLTGTPGATRNVIIPFRYLSATTAVGGMWIVDNQTNATQNILTEASGSSGVSVIAGRRALVFSDGTDVKFADDARLIGGTGISVTGSTVSLSTPVSVANGGTGLTTLTAGNVILGAGTSAPTFVAPGTSGNVLTSNGSSWISSAPTGGGGGGISSISFGTASGMGFTFTPNNVTTSAQTVTLSGTLSVQNGGTGNTSITGFVKGNGTGAFSGQSLINLATEVTGTLSQANGGTGTLGSGVGTALGQAVTGSGGFVLNAGNPTINSNLNVNGDITLQASKGFKVGIATITSDGSNSSFNLSTSTSLYGGPTLCNCFVAGTAVWLANSSSFTVQVTPQAYQANFNVISDARTKKDVAPYAKTLPDVLSLNPVTFKYNGMYGTKDDNIPRVGLIAQDVLPTTMSEIVGERVWEDPVTKQKTTVYDLNPSELVFALINTVKELDARVKALEAKVGP